MRTERVALHFLADPRALPVAIALREPSGEDELALAGIDTGAAVGLIDRLIDDSLGMQERPDAINLSASDRDALLAALHRLCWGDRIVSTLACSACGDRFDLSFELSALQMHLCGNRKRLEPSLHVPDAADELACASAASIAEAVQALAERSGMEPWQDVEPFAETLEAVAPILDVDLDARCPECGTHQLAHFDVQSFLLQRLLNERERLLDEVHILAECYGWSLSEILGLARSTRRSLAQRIMDGRTP
jgi:hypothetical protein